MSWTVSTQAPVPVGDIVEALEALKIEGPGDPGPVVEEQLRAAKDAAGLMVDRGVVGDGDVRISLSGHANPGPVEGVAKPSVAVVVSKA